MRWDKFRYVMMGKSDNKIYYKWYYLKQIESGLNNLFDVENYEIISRDDSTGLKDKNGNEIYEGDILRIEESISRGDGLYDDGISAVIFENGCFNTDYDYLYVITNDCEVIGNIHENQNLIT